MARYASLSSALIKLHRLIMTDKKDVGSVYFFAITGGIISLSLPLGIQTIISFVMAATLSTSIVVLIAIVIAGVFLNGLMQVRQLQVIERIRQKIFTRYTLEFSDKIPKINLEEIDGYYLPEMVNRFFDIKSLTKSIEKLLIDIPTSVIQILLALILLSFYHPIFIAFGAFVLLVIAFIIRVTSPKGLTTSMQASDYKYMTAEWLEEVARGAKTFRYSKGSGLHMTRTDELLTGYLKSRTSHFNVLTTQYWSLIIFKILTVASMLIAGSWLLLNQQINVGQFIASDIVIILIINSVEKLIATMDNVYESLTSLEKLSKVVDNKIETSGNLPFATNKPCSVKFDDVIFAYPQGNFSLKSVNINAAPNSITCISGTSGSGKSTILRLLIGAYQNFNGSILLNDLPIGNYNLKQLRGCTGIMLNDQDIFRGTIFENLTMGNKDIAMDDIIYLAEKTGLKNFILATEKGYDTALAPTGKRLSHSVKQNIKLMRALLGKPLLLLLEEPFVHLPEINKQNMMAYIKKESGATVFIVSNDENIKAMSDAVYQLKEGVIIN
jgi:ATP-binding cassette, subfamily B, bacterial